jgi:hypothetical protein
MQDSEASDLAAFLFASYPSFRDSDELTVAVYAKMIAKLPDQGLALTAIEELIAYEEFMPSIAKINQQYRAVFNRQPPRPALPEAEPTEEERRANLKMAKEMINKMAGSLKTMP